MVGAPARAQPVQLASLEVVTQSSSSIGLPQYVSLIMIAILPRLARADTEMPRALLS